MCIGVRDPLLAVIEFIFGTIFILTFTVVSVLLYITDEPVVVAGILLIYCGIDVDISYCCEGIYDITLIYWVLIFLLNAGGLVVKTVSIVMTVGL